MPSSASKKRVSNLNSTISVAQCPPPWTFVNGKCYQVIVEYHFCFNFVLRIARILQLLGNFITWDAAAATCMTLCTPPSSMCHLPRLYSVQQGLDLNNHGNEFHEYLSMYKLIWSIRLLNCVFFSFCGINKAVLTKKAND